MKEMNGKGLVFNGIKQLINAVEIDFLPLIVFCMVGIKRDHYEYEYIVALTATSTCQHFKENCKSSYDQRSAQFLQEICLLFRA